MLRFRVQRWCCIAGRRVGFGDGGDAMTFGGRETWEWEVPLPVVVEKGGEESVSQS